MISQASNSLLNKIALIGSDGSGKTSLLLKYSNPGDDISKKEKIRSRIADSKLISKQLNDINNRPIEITCYDTVGSESQKSLSRHLYRNALAIIIVFDLKQFCKNETECLNQIKKWYKFSYAPDNEHQIIPLTYFVGTKLDLLSEEQQNDYQNRRNKLFLKMNKIEKQYYLETSAYSNINIERLFDDIFKGVFLEFIATTITFAQFQNLNVFTLKQANDQNNESSINTKNQSKNYTSLYSVSQSSRSSRQGQAGSVQQNNQNNNNEINIPQDQINDEEIQINNQSEQYQKKSQNSQKSFIQNKNKTEKSSSCC
ncbi:hypothetical protein ABPG72_006071 [Tetrahymena utriculariae]